MTNKEIKKLYKDQLDQHYSNFLEKEKEEISKVNLNSEILKKYYFNGAKSSVKIINLLTELDNRADKFVKENKKEISELNLNPTILSNIYTQGAFDNIQILTQIRKNILEENKMENIETEAKNYAVNRRNENYDAESDIFEEEIEKQKKLAEDFSKKCTELNLKLSHFQADEELSFMNANPKSRLELAEENQQLKKILRNIWNINSHGNMEHFGESVMEILNNADKSLWEEKKS